MAQQDTTLRLSLCHSRSQIEEAFKADYGIYLERHPFRNQFLPRKYIPPKTEAVVIRRRLAAGLNERGDHDDTIITDVMNWNFVPTSFTCKSPKWLHATARSESIKGCEEGHMYHDVRSNQRCAIPCSGLVVWERNAKRKFPFFVCRRDKKLMLIAGIYSQPLLRRERQQTYFAAVTCPRGGALAWLSDRLPVMLPSRHALNIWLDTTSGRWTDEIADLLSPYDGDRSEFLIYQVTEKVKHLDIPITVRLLEPVNKSIKDVFALQRKKEEESENGIRATKDTPLITANSFSLDTSIFTPSSGVLNIPGHGHIEHNMSMPTVESGASRFLVAHVPPQDDDTKRQRPIRDTPLHSQGRTLPLRTSSPMAASANAVQCSPRQIATNVLNV